MTPLDGLEPYRGTEDRWNDLLSRCQVDTLFISPRWQKVWWDQFGDGAEKLVLCLKKSDGEVDGIAPLARREGTISFIGSEDLFDYNDFLVCQGGEHRFYSSLLNYLNGEVWDTLDLVSLRENSPTLAYLPDLARERGYTVVVEEEDVAPGLELPASWEDYLQALSKKDRHELKRKMRRLHSSGEEVGFQKLSGPGEVEDGLEDFLCLMRFSKEDKQRFLTEPRERFFRSIAREMAEAGAIRLFFLALGGQRVAAALCFDYGGARLLYNSGFSPAFSYYSVGLLLKAMCVRDAIEEGKTYFDFLRGPEPYKYDLGGINRTLYQMVVRRS